MGPVRLVNEIVDDPRRSTGWKVFDVSLLAVLWFGLVFLVFATFADRDWGPLLRLWIPLTLIASMRSWYLHPRRRNSAPTA